METFAMRKQSSAEAREKELVVQGVHAPNIHELLQQVIFNQQRQLAMVRSIRWVIIGFGVWFITQFWLLPKLLIAR